MVEFDVLELLDKENPYSNSRDSGVVKVVFHPSDLKKKGIRFFLNNNDETILNKTIKRIKNLLGMRWANNVMHLTYYAGGRVISPFHCYVSSNGLFEFTLFDFLGQKSILSFSRKLEDTDDSFTEEELTSISKTLEGYYHLVSFGYNEMYNKFGKTPMGYAEYIEIRKSL
jgi:hypothetical protein